MKIKLGMAAILACLMIWIIPMRTEAAFPALSETAPMSGSGWKKANYTIYQDVNLTQEAETVSYQNCTVSKISGNAVRVTYKVNGQKKVGWMPLDKFIYDVNYEHQISYAAAAVTLYRRPSGTASKVKIKLYSGGIEVGEKGNWKQVLFKSGSKYQLGWIRKPEFASYIRLSMETTTQVLANAAYTLTPCNNSAKALTYDATANRFLLAENSKAEAQRFTFTHVRSNLYRIDVAGTGEQMMIANSNLKAAAASEVTWFVKRTGAYFYICDSAKKYCLTYSAGTVKIAKWNKKKTQKWTVSKLPVTPTKETSVVFSQYDPKWGGSTYYKGKIKRTISTSGCGVVALTNAIYALNGEFINPKSIASFSAKRGHYYYMQGTADTLYADYANKNGKKYHFKHSGKVYTVSKLKKHLKKGGTAVALVPGHYIAIVAYRASDNHYLVLDSAVYDRRPTTIAGDWVSASTLRSGTLNCEYFHLFSRR